MLLFKPEHAGAILSGLKTQTRRIWKKRKAKPGSTHRAKVKMLGKDYFALLRIGEVYQERLGDITEEDAGREGGYTVESFKKKWIEINGSWNPEQLVWVVNFKVERKTT